MRGPAQGPQAGFRKRRGQPSPSGAEAPSQLSEPGDGRIRPVLVLRLGAGGLARGVGMLAIGVSWSLPRCSWWTW